MSAALIWNASILIRLHSHQYLFYNPLVGGLHGAAGRYVTDYWVNIMPEAVKDLDSFLKHDGETSSPPHDRFNVAVGFGLAMLFAGWPRR